MRPRAVARATALAAGIVAVAPLVLAAPAGAAVAAPSAPRSVTATPGNRSVVVRWKPPATSGGSAVRAYRATAGSRSCTTGPAARTCTITGLTNGVRVGVQVQASNRTGAGAKSLPVLVVPRTVPGAPQAVTVRPGSGYAVVTWSAPASTGGAPVLGYTATSGSRSCTALAPRTTCTVTGLVDGRTALVTVRARNAAGSGATSGAVAVRPRAESPLDVTGDSGTGQGGTDLTGLEPRTVAAPASTWSGVDTGADHTCAVLADHTLWCWGGNGSGQLGVGGTTHSDTPAQVGTDTDWATVSAGDRATCATRTDHGLWCWGLGLDGRLGLGDTTSHDVPVRVGSASDWASVSVGGGQTCAVTTGGTLWCWGRDDAGQLGLGDTTARTAPVQVGTDTTWVAVSTGTEHTCGLQADRTLWCWGDGAHGALGVGTTDDSSVPVAVDPATDWTQVSAGDGHTCGTGGDGDLWCWGNGGAGQVGDGTRTDRPWPASVGEGIGWSSPSAGDGWTCAVRVGELRCWGTDLAAGLGGPTSDGPAVPEPYASWTLPGPEWVAVSVGGAHACGLADPATLLCFGAGGDGRLGRAVSTTHLVRVGAARTTWSAVSASDGAACGLRGDLSLWCWGETSEGRLPTGGSAPSSTPQPMDAAGPWSEVSLGATSGCAIGIDGSLWCWGSRSDGQVGDGVLEGAVAGATRVGAPTGWSRVSVGATHACALRVDGSLWCWGDGFGGGLGLGSATDRGTPTRVGTGTWTDVSAGDLVTCGTRSDGRLLCWGEATGVVGAGLHLDALSGNVLVPTPVDAATTWRSVSLGTGFGCGTRADDSLWCWGDGADGRLGLGDTTDHGVPTRVGSLTTWTAVTAGDAHACALRSDDTAWCWGRGDLGRLGQGDETTQTSPVHVADEVTGIVAAGATTYVLG